MMVREDMDKTSLKTCLSGAIFIAKEAGKAIMDIYNTDFTVYHKDDNSPLTLSDRRSHEIIVRHLTTQSPDPYTYTPIYPVLSEEGKSILYEERKNWEYSWLVDPLDGTKEFIKRNGEFTVNIALIHINKPVLGVIYIPVKDLFYFAAKGIGSYKITGSEIVESVKPLSKGIENAEEILDTILTDSTILPLNHSTHPPAHPFTSLTVVGSRSHMSKETETYIEELKTVHREINTVSAGSSLKFCLVAEGKADIYPRFGPTMEWDTAAGQAVVEEAGGKVLNVDTGEPLSYNKEDLQNPWFIASRD